MRIRIDLAYDGTAFHGWATQPGLRTVQGDLEAALATALRLPEEGSRAGVVCAGRTDTGVHARGQVVHVDVDAGVVGASAGRSPEPPLEALLRRLNGILDADVRVLRVTEAPPGFDARFSALWRRYCYRVADAPALVDPLTRTSVLSWPRELDPELLTEASAPLLGQHDFAAFCKRREGATSIRTLLDLSWTRAADGVLTATVRADAFCHSMVRGLVGCLLAVGDGRQPVTWPAEVLAARSRDTGLTVAPAHGLTLEEVAYPPDADLADRAVQTRARRPELDDGPEDCGADGHAGP